MNITSNNTMIFAKEFDGKMHYRTSMSRKNQNNEYEKAYIDIKLPKGIQLADKSKIDITKGFLSFYKNKEGKDIFYIVVQDLRTEYENYNQNKEEPKEDVYAQFGSQITVEDLDKGMDLPF